MSRTSSRLCQERGPLEADAKPPTDDKKYVAPRIKDGKYRSQSTLCGHRVQQSLTPQPLRSAIVQESTHDVGVPVHNAAGAAQPERRSWGRFPPTARKDSGSRALCRRTPIAFSTPSRPSRITCSGPCPRRDRHDGWIVSRLPLQAPLPVSLKESEIRPPGRSGCLRAPCAPHNTPAGSSFTGRPVLHAGRQQLLGPGKDDDGAPQVERLRFGSLVGQHQAEWRPPARADRQLLRS